MPGTTFRIHNADVSTPSRHCPTLLTPGEEDQLAEAGFVTPARRLPPAALRVLRSAADHLAAARFTSPEQKTYQDEFAGQYLRDPHKADPRLLTVPLLDYPLADTVRTLLGPRITLRNSNIRITHPGTSDSTVWHTDFRPHVSPHPRLGGGPVIITALVYLDPADLQTGPLYVIRGSHLTPAQPAATLEPLAGQEELLIEPGQVIVMNAALWHRGGPNTSRDRIRRLLTLQMSTIFLSPYNFGSAPPSAAWTQLIGHARNTADEPLLELLGLGGINPVSALY
jgi:Phytanoyl-CoA dioxygenase (PhyH)